MPHPPHRERLKLLIVVNVIMSYQLVLSEPVGETTREIGENVFFDNLPPDSEVYLLYYPGAMPNKELENKLRDFGNNAGKNLFVNIGKLNDPNFKKISNKFDLGNFPVIIVTASSKLASHSDEYETAYVKLDSKNLLNSLDLAIDCVQKLFLLFIQGKIAEALRQPGKYDRKALISRLNGVITNALKGVEVSASLLGGKLEVKWKGE